MRFVAHNSEMHYDAFNCEMHFGVCNYEMHFFFMQLQNTFSCMHCGMQHGFGKTLTALMWNLTWGQCCVLGLLQCTSSLLLSHCSKLSENRPVQITWHFQLIFQKRNHSSRSWDILLETITSSKQKQKTNVASVVNQFTYKISFSVVCNWFAP